MHLATTTDAPSPRTTKTTTCTRRATAQPTSAVAGGMRSEYGRATAQPTLAVAGGMRSEYGRATAQPTSAVAGGMRSEYGRATAM